MAHQYSVVVEWTGNRGSGTSAYAAYSRDHQIFVEGKTTLIAGSADASFRGDPAKYNPEELLVEALSACHMLAFLHLCADAGIVVTAYRDTAAGSMQVQADGAGQFTKVTLRPHVAITDGTRLTELDALHHRAHEVCFIARSVNFTVGCEATGVTQQG
ncbi:MAG: OsmC family protein [Acidobacteriota bacterium]